jgi:hypothetical protein
MEDSHTSHDVRHDRPPSRCQSLTIATQRTYKQPANDHLGLVGERVLGVDEAHQLHDLLHAFEVAAARVFDLQRGKRQERESRHRESSRLQAAMLQRRVHVPIISIVLAQHNLSLAEE